MTSPSKALAKEDARANKLEHAATGRGAGTTIARASNAKQGGRAGDDKVCRVAASGTRGAGANPEGKNQK